MPSPDKTFAEHFKACPTLSKSDVSWLRRGQRIGEMLLTTRKYAAYGCAGMLIISGASLVMLALLTTPPG